VYDTPRTIDQILRMRASMPSHLAGLTEGLAPAQLLVSPEPRVCIPTHKANPNPARKQTTQTVRKDRESNFV
jgi:hypothetical protein